MKAILRNFGWIIGALGVLSLLGYAFRPQPFEVDTAPAVRGPLVVSVNAEGKTRIRERYVVSAPLSGQLQRIRHRPGDPVSAGESVLAVIEPADPSLIDARTKAEIEAKVKATNAARQQADSGLSRARSTHQLAVSQLRRAKELRDGGGLSVDEYDTAVSKEMVAANEVKAAEFAVRVAEFEHEMAKAARIRIQPRLTADTEQDRFEIRSPIGGLVLRVFQESEAVIGGGTRLLELGDPRDLEMEIDVLSTDAVKIRNGARVIVDHWGGPEPLAGRVRVIEPAGFLKVSALGVEEQRVNVIADFTDPLDKRKPLGDAYRVEAQIVISEGETLKVPSGALFRRNGQWACFTQTNGRAKIREVKVGRSNGLETEVSDGLQEGEPVIVHPSDRVTDGVRVTGS